MKEYKCQVVKDCDGTDLSFCPVCHEGMCKNHSVADKSWTALCMDCKFDIETWRNGDRSERHPYSLLNEVEKTKASGYAAMQGKSKMPWATPKKAKPNPLNTQWGKVNVGKDIGMLIMSPAIFTEMTAHLCNGISDAGAHDEIAGFGYLDENDSLVWTYRDEEAVGSAAHVESGDGKATVDALVAGFGVPNFQWHTHPGFDPNPSGVDTANMMRHINTAMKVSESGQYTYAVISALDWHVLRIRWEDGKITRNRLEAIVVAEKDSSMKPFVLSYPEKNYSYTTYYQPAKNGKAFEPVDYIAPYGGGMYGGMYGVDMFNDNFYMGSYSVNEKDYDPLFEAQGVKKYDWEELYSVIAAAHGPAIYYDAVDHPHFHPKLWGRPVVEQLEEVGSGS